MRTGRTLAVILLISLVVHLGFVFATEVLAWDEYSYLSNARGIVSDSIYTEDFRFPLLPLVIAGLWTLTGESTLLARLLMVGITLTSIAVFHILASRYSKRAWIYTALFAFSSLMIEWGSKIYTDIGAILLSLSAITIALGREEKNRPMLIAGGLAGLAFLMRYPVVIGPAVYGAMLLIERRWKAAMLLLAGTLAVLAPWIAYNIIAYSDPIYLFSSQLNVVNEYYAFQNPLIVFAHLFSVFSLSLLAIAFVRFKDRDERTIIIVTIASLIILLSLSLKLERYIIMILPYMLMLIMLGTDRAIARWPNRTTVILVLITLSILISSALNTYEAASRVDCTRDGALSESIAWVEANVPEGTKIASDHWVYYAYPMRMDVVAMWTEDLELLREKEDPELIITSFHEGLTVDSDTLDASPLIWTDQRFEDSCGEIITIYRYSG